MEDVDISGLYTDSLEGVVHDLDIHQARRMSRTRQDSGRSGTYLKHDSGFLTNSSDILSRDESPTRESLLRKARSRSPTMGKYVIDRYKNPAVETIRNHQIISTFEDLELEKLLLKDENADMRDKVLQMQGHLRLLETARIRDAERFDLQEREVNALRLQLKTEKETRQSSNTLVEELQSDLTRKTDLLSLANEELIETRERLRMMDRRLQEEGDSRSHAERNVREHKDRVEDLSSELDMEKKVNRSSMEAIRELKEEVSKLRDELGALTDGIKEVSRAFESPVSNQVHADLRLRNEDLQQKLARVVQLRNELCDKVVTCEREVKSRTAQFEDFDDEIHHLSRVLRSETKDELVGNSLLSDAIFREQRSVLANAKMSAGMEPLQTAIVTFLDFEMKKRKVFRDSVEDILKKFSWKETGLNDSQLAQLLQSILSSWSSLREHHRQIYTRLKETKQSIAAAAHTASQGAVALRGALMTYKNTVLTASRHKLDEEFYRFIDNTRTQHDVIKRVMKAAHQKHLIAEIQRAKSEQDVVNAESVGSERKRAEQLNATIDELTANIREKQREVEKLQDETKSAESKLFRTMEEARRVQHDHQSALDSLAQSHNTVQQALQKKLEDLQLQIGSGTERLQREIDQKAKTISALEETIAAKEQKVAQVQKTVKENSKKQEALQKELAAERDPAKNQKLLLAIKAYEREVGELRAKIVERDTLVGHLKKRVDEALNRSQKKANEVAERSRIEIGSKESKLVEKEKEIEKLQGHLIKVNRMMATKVVPAQLPTKLTPASFGKENAETSTTRTNTVKSASNAAIKSVSGSDTTRLPPIMPPMPAAVTSSSTGNGAGTTTANDSNQVSRRTTARSEAGSMGGKPRSRTQSTTRSNKPKAEWQN